MSQRQHPNRINCWLSDEDTWLHPALEDLVREFEAQGVKTSKGDLIRQALLKTYGSRKAKYVNTDNSNGS